MPSGDKIRVLIVDDVSETRENVRKLLQFESDVDVVGVARTGKEAIQLSQDLNPDVVLMDINMPDMDGIAATEAIRSKQPVVQVVILSVQGDQNYMRRGLGRLGRRQADGHRPPRPLRRRAVGGSPGGGTPQAVGLRCGVCRHSSRGLNGSE